MAVAQATPENTYAGSVSAVSAQVIPVTLLDLDAAGLDFTQPCPLELVEFIYESSEDGTKPITIWSKLLTEQNGTTIIWTWFNDAVTLWRDRTVTVQTAPATEVKPTGDGITEITYSGEGSGAVTPPAAPVNVDVPLVTGDGDVGQTLNCTMGNWDGEPTGYAYQWKADNTDIGNGDSNYVIVEGDAGKTITCVVTATNAAGSTVAPPSSGVVVADGATTTARHTRRN